MPCDNCIFLYPYFEIGLCARDSQFSWKILFDHGGLNFELLFSASSATEEKQWKTEIIKSAAELVQDGARNVVSNPDTYFFVTLALMPLNIPPESSPEETPSLPRTPSMPFLAATRPRSNSREVCIKKTNYPNNNEDSVFQDGEQPKRSRSVYSRREPPALTPRRQDRIRLEKFIADIYTRDVLPFPGMALAKGDILSRTGSLIRRFSLQGFRRRSSSFGTTHTNFSIEEANHARDDEIRGNSTLAESSINQERMDTPRDAPGNHAIAKTVSARASGSDLSVHNTESKHGGDSRLGPQKKRDSHTLRAAFLRGNLRPSLKENESH